MKRNRPSSFGGQKSVQVSSSLYLLILVSPVFFLRLKKKELRSQVAGRLGGSVG